LIHADLKPIVTVCAAKATATTLLKAREVRKGTPHRVRRTPSSSENELRNDQAANKKDAIHVPSQCISPNNSIEVLT
jgi:hypothetical protein